MKIKKIYLILTLLVACLIFTSCQKQKDPVKKDTLETVLTTYKNNSEVKEIEGVVYGMQNDGFYISDSAVGRIFVTKPSTEVSLSVGDKVKVTGKYSFGYATEKIPQIVSTTVEKLSGNNDTIQPIADSSVADIYKMVAATAKGAYGQICKITITVTKNENGIYILTDDDARSIMVDGASNYQVIDGFINKRISLPVIVHAYSTEYSKWIVSFTGTQADIVDASIPFSELKEKALTDINARVAKTIYGAIELPTVHPMIGYLTYKWTVEENEFFSINENGKAIIKIDQNDHNVALKVTISNGSTEETVDYPIVSKGIVEQTLGNLFANQPEVNMSMVQVRGIVVGIARNQSVSLRSYILMDPLTKDTTTVDFANTGDFILNSSDEFKKVKIGDEIVVLGQFRNGDDDRTCIMSVTRIDVLSQNNKFDYNKDDAYVLKTESDYNNLGKNLKQYENKLVKFDNPFLNYSTSTTPSTTNWVILGDNATNGSDGYGEGTYTHRFAFLIACQNESLGSDSWHTQFEIPFLNSDAKQFDISFYAYCLYISETYVAFLIPSAECMMVSELVQIKLDITSKIPTTVEGGKIDLLDNHSSLGDAKITWESSNEAVINPTTGEVKEVEENTEVKLTAKFTYNGKEESLEFIVNVLPNIALTVTDLLANAKDGDKVKVNGVVLTYIWDGNTSTNCRGVVLMDNATGKVVLVDGNEVIGGSYGSYLDSNKEAYGIGDIIEITGTYYLNSAKIGTSGPDQTGRVHMDIIDGGKVVVKEKNVEIDYSKLDVETISSQEELTSFAANLKYGKVLKFVGTAEKPIYVGCSSSKLPFNLKLFYTDTHVADDAKYAGPNGKTYVFALKSDVNAAIAGENWWEELCGFTTPFVGPKTGVENIPLIGEVYVTVGYWTSTYYQMTIINADNCTLHRMPTAETISEELISVLPDTLSSGDFAIELPVTHAALKQNVVWTVDKSDIINLETKKVARVTTDTVVEFTATFTFNGETKTVNKQVTVLAPIAEAPITVSEVFNKVNAAIVNVKGVVAGYVNPNSKDASNLKYRGIILMDTATKKFIYVDNMEAKGGTHGAYKVASDATTTIALGDELKIETASVAIADDDRVSVEISEDSTLEVVSSNNAFAFDLENAYVISCDAEATAFASKPVYNRVVKFTGTTENPFFFGCTSSSDVTGNYRLHFKNDATITEKKGVAYNGEWYSFSGNYNQINLENEWWKTKLGFEKATVCPSKTNPANKFGFTGEFYAVLGQNVTINNYFQFSFVNPTGFNVTKLA